MRVVAISDIHVKKPQDEADQLLTRFLNHPDVMSSDYVLLLGDIFDLMCGPHDEYLMLFNHHFKDMIKIQKGGAKVFFIEGNHDLHLENLFSKFQNEGEIILSHAPQVRLIDGKKYYFSHGDEHEVDNISYQRYIRTIRSRPMKYIANKIMPYAVLNFFGERASMVSRKKGSKSFDVSLVRDRFRQGVCKTTKGEFDFVIGGHSHVQDMYKLPGTKSTYLNNGHALSSNTFIKIENHEPTFVSL
jgi:UDP-2,3-diacylglucosamine hydrolase